MIKTDWKFVELNKDGSPASEYGVNTTAFELGTFVIPVDQIEIELNQPKSKINQLIGILKNGWYLTISDKLKRKL